MPGRRKDLPVTVAASRCRGRCRARNKVDREAADPGIDARRRPGRLVPPSAEAFELVKRSGYFHDRRVRVRGEAEGRIQAQSTRSLRDYAADGDRVQVDVAQETALVANG